MVIEIRGADVVNHLGEDLIPLIRIAIFLGKPSAKARDLAVGEVLQVAVKLAVAGDLRPVVGRTGGVMPLKIVLLDGRTHSGRRAEGDKLVKGGDELRGVRGRRIGPVFGINGPDGDTGCAEEGGLWGAAMAGEQKLAVSTCCWVTELPLLETLPPTGFPWRSIRNSISPGEV